MGTYSRVFVAEIVFPNGDVGRTTVWYRDVAMADRDQVRLGARFTWIRHSDSNGVVRTIGLRFDGAGR